MIIMRLMGGLGNQMFQYALGRMLSLKHNVPLKLDLSAFGLDPLRDYALGHLNIIEEFATQEECQRLRPNQGIGLLFRFAQYLLPNAKRTFIEEKVIGYDPRIMSVSPPAYFFSGYWQSPRYFSSIEDTLRSDFRYKKAQEGRNRELEEEIKNCMAVSVHVRRGDFVNNPETQKVHWNCTPEYYTRAMTMIGEKVAQPHFFVFSDEPDWARENIQCPGPAVVVDHNGPELFHEDMRLMSQCQHHIVANSSFSWWGAWLNPGKEKIVIAPEKWYNFDYLKPRDHLPPSWVQI